MQENASSRPEAGYQNTYGRRKKKRSYRRRNRRIALCAGTGAAVVALLVLLTHLPKTPVGTAAEAGASSTETQGEQATFDANDPYLVLVNNNLPLAEDYVPTVADAADGKQLETTAAAAYQAMAAAAKEDGVSLLLCSGYRDYAYQQGLFEKRTQKYIDQGYEASEAATLAQTVVAKPGCSEHQTGLAADIVTESHQGLDSGFADTKAFRWLSENAAGYGFILRYPETRQVATGIIYEPWHWRYVGTENAKAIVKSGLSLEEFMALHTAGLT